MKRLPPALLLVALTVAVPAASAVGPAPEAAVAAKQKQRGQPRLSVSRLGRPPARAVQVGDTIKLKGVARNRGRKAGRSDIKLIVPKRDGATNGRKLDLLARKRIGPRSTRRIRFSFTVPKKLAPAGGETVSSSDLAACIRRHGKGSKFRCKPVRRPLRVGLVPLPPNFKPGGRTLGDPLFPQTGNTGYDVGHYEIDLDYRPSDNTFLAGTKTRIAATATQDLGQFSLDFQDLDVTRVDVEGSEAAFEQVAAKPALAGATQPMKLVVTPDAGIPDGEDFSVVVHYRGKPVRMTDPDGSSEGWVRACVGVATPLTCDGALVVNEPIGAQGWFPSNNYPTDKATFTTKITVPNAHTAIGTGELAQDPPQSLSGGKRRWVWNEDDPTATYLTTATVGRFDVTRTTVAETGAGRTLPAFFAVDSAVTPLQQPGIDATFGRVESMLNFLAGDYGPYPFDSTGAIVDNVPTLGYALEVQTKPAFAYFAIDDETMLHEQAHQWFGDSVSPATWGEIWFNEGYAEWSTWSWDNLENGNPDTPGDRFDAEYADASASDWSIPPATLGGDPANLFDFFATYVRAPMMLEGYKQIVGNSKFYELAAEIQAGRAHGNISTAEWIEAAEAKSGFGGAQLQLLDDYFQQWLYGDVKPTILPGDFGP